MPPDKLTDPLVMWAPIVALVPIVAFAALWLMGKIALRRQKEDLDEHWEVKGEPKEPKEKVGRKCSNVE